MDGYDEIVAGSSRYDAARIYAFASCSRLIFAASSSLFCTWRNRLGASVITPTSAIGRVQGVVGCLGGYAFVVLFYF